MGMTNAERQAAFRKRLREQGKYPFTYYLTENEKFFLDRTLMTMRELNATPAMVRTEKGTLQPIDV